jgi:hypothetical protein
LFSQSQSVQEGKLDTALTFNECGSSDAVAMGGKDESLLLDRRMKTSDSSFVLSLALPRSSLFTTLAHYTTIETSNTTKTGGQALTAYFSGHATFNECLK